MSIDAILDANGAHTLRLIPVSFSAKWATSYGDDKAVRRFQTVGLAVDVEPHEGPLKPVAERFRKGWVSIFSTEEKPQLDKLGRPAMGFIMPMASDSLNFGLIASADQVVTLIGLLSRPNAQLFKVEVRAFERMEDWQATSRDVLHIREWSIEICGALAISHWDSKDSEAGRGDARK